MNDLLEFIRSVSGAPDEDVNESTELIMSGVLDSMNMAALLAYIESRTGQSVDIGEVDLEMLSTAQQIWINYLSSEK